MATHVDEVDPTGPLHSVSGADSFWSTTNVGEALPGVATPLGWSLWGPAVELGVRDCFARMGALAPSEVCIPPAVDERLTSVFFGRAALNVNFFCRMGGRLPGTGPDAIARQLLGEVPDGVPLETTLSRMSSVAFKMPYALATVRRDLLVRAAPTKPWWGEWVRRLDGLDLDESRFALIEASERFTEMIRVQAGGVFIAVQSVYAQLNALIDKAGLDHEHANALVSGQGAHAEVEIINDLWAMGRDQLDLGTFLSRHGYHGPLEGEVSGRVWREDSTPVIRLAEQYAERKDQEDPATAAEARAAARRQAERLLLAELPRAQRAPARLVLRMAVSRIPLRGVAKAAYLQSLDVARGAARRMGTHLAEQGVLDDPEDVFLFTVDELRTRLPGYAREMVAERRAQREQFQRHTIPAHWRGNPVPTPFAVDPAIGRADYNSEASAAETVVGIGASGGTVEGIVRVVHDPSFAEVEPDEVLVCVTTDPSWASVLFLSSALVVDIGGLLSHAAVVAREVGVPCVIGTLNGTAVLRTGDLVRVDGNAGTVEILKRVSVDPEGVGSSRDEMESA